MTTTKYQKSKLDVQALFNNVAKSYDLTNNVLSGGMHHTWRRALVELIPDTIHRPGSDRVLDVCCGTGALFPYLVERLGGVTGVDFSSEMLARIPSDPRTPVICADALSLPFKDSQFTVVTVAFGVRNFENFEVGISEIWRVLEAGGYLLVLEFGQPSSNWFRKIFSWYSSTVIPFIGGVISGDRDAYRYLPQTSAKFPCGDYFCQLVEKQKFSVVSWKSLTMGICYAYCMKKIG